MQSRFSKKAQSDLLLQFSGHHVEPIFFCIRNMLLVKTQCLHQYADYIQMTISPTFMVGGDVWDINIYHAQSNFPNLKLNSDPIFFFFFSTIENQVQTDMQTFRQSFWPERRHWYNAIGWRDILGAF